MVWIKLIIETVIVFLISTIVFDVVHFLLHQCLKSNHKWLRSIGRLHSIHHRFFPFSLKIQTECTQANLLYHVFFEYSVQVGGILLCYLFFSPLVILLALVAETLLFILICLSRGVDLHHKPYDKLPAYRGGLFVSADYHALHHIYPNQFFSGYIKIFDYLFGTGMPLAGKRIAMTGASGALGSNMKKLLEKEGAIVTPFKFGVDYDYHNYEKLSAPLAQTDILLLCHGSKYDFAQQANCDSYISIIELFKSSRPQRRVPLEVWATGSEIECHPCFGIKKIQVYARSKRNYAKAARSYYHDRDIQYRHLVHSAFTSRMGMGLMSAKFAARLTLFLLKRGFKYIPVTYTGFAYLNYFRFAVNIRFAQPSSFN